MALLTAPNGVEYFRTGLKSGQYDLGLSSLMCFICFPEVTPPRHKQPSEEKEERQFVGHGNL